MKIGRLIEILQAFPNQAEVFKRDSKGLPDAVEADIVMTEREVFVYRDEQGSERLCLVRLPDLKPFRTFKAVVLKG